MDDLKQQQDGDSLESGEGLESQSNDVVSASEDSLESTNGVHLEPGTLPANRQPQSKGPKKRFTFRSLLERINVYFVLFVFLIIIGSGVALAAYLKGRHPSQTPSSNIKSQNLSAQALQQLASSGTTIGGANQTLNIQSNSVFSGSVLVRGNLDIAGIVSMSTPLTLSSLTVGGTSSFGQLQAKGISVAGNMGVQGSLSAQSLSVAGSGNFNGALTALSVTTGSLQLSGDLNIDHHINTGGPVPGRVNGSALGGGGTSSVSGSDTAGTINISTGSGASIGCFVTVNFANNFGNTPNVVITPVGASAGALQYYINRTSSSFSVCTTNTPPSNASFGFDYIVIG